MAKITPEELVQVVEEFLQEDLKLDPPQIGRFFTSNIFGRALSHVVGWTGRTAKMLRCTEAGELKVAPTSTGIETYQVYTGDATDAWGAVKEFTAVAARVDLFVWDNPMYFQIVTVGDVYLGAIEVPVGFYSVDMRTPKFRLMNKAVGQTARYQVIGWW